MPRWLRSASPWTHVALRLSGQPATPDDLQKTTGRVSTLAWGWPGRAPLAQGNRMFIVSIANSPDLLTRLLKPGSIPTDIEPTGLVIQGFIA